MRSKICIINTGGTIGMSASRDGFTPNPGYMEEQLATLSELKRDDMPGYDFFEYEQLLDSSNITVNDWNKIGRDIKRLYQNYDGFVILHGTDTMAYTASALSFMLEDLGKPVILTGSQIPFCMVRSDARDNLITAAMFAGQYAIPEVCIYFGGMLFRGNRATKVSSDMLIAFDSPNCEALAKAGVNISVNEKLIRPMPKTKALKFCEFANNKIAVLKIFPGIQFDIFRRMVNEDLRGIIIEGFGSGNIPNNDKSMREVLTEARDEGVLIVVCTQCLKGFAEIGKYETSNALAQVSAISGLDMTVEAAVTKLYYLFSKNLSADSVRNLMGNDIRGELTY